MKQELTQEDFKNLLALINVAPIKGQEATTVAILQQKLIGLLTPESKEEPKDESGKETKTK